MADEWDRAREEAYRRQRERANGPYTDYGADTNGPLGGDPPPPLEVVDLADLAGQPIREVKYLDGHRHWPKGYCMMLSSDGGGGKSTLLAQQHAAMTGGFNFLGLPIEQGPTMFYSAEERIDIMRARVLASYEAEDADMSRAHGIYYIDRAKGIHWLFREDMRHGGIILTDDFHRLVDSVAKYKPMSLVIDNRARVFSGNQNDSALATEIVATLDDLAEDFDMSITFLSHPSLSGIKSGRGDSGSVAWSNAGRMRDYLCHADEEWCAGKPDNGKRVLINMKASHGAPREPIELEWCAGRFHCNYQPPKAGDNIGKADRAERVFMLLLRLHNERNINLSAAPSSRNYAPKIFSGHPKAERISTRSFTLAMTALFEDGKIVNAKYGAPSDQTFHLVVAEMEIGA